MPDASQPLPQPLVDAVTGFGDAFLVPIIFRWSLNIDGVNKCSSYYSGGEIAGTIWGLVPFALEDAAAWGASRGSLLNRNRWFRIGPGGGFKYGELTPRISSPFLPGDGHFSLLSKLPKIPPLGFLFPDSDCGCQSQ